MSSDDKYNSYWFDTLPCHPQPQPYEAFSSYRIRLAEANHLRNINGLSRLSFPDGRGRFTLNSGDYPVDSFGLLGKLAVCSEKKLIATTFYHLGRKFDRLLLPLPMAHFLSGAIAPHLRYCPHCLSERGYYSLIWRFLMLEGCSEHGCKLLDHCGHCGQTVPLMHVVPRLGICPTCNGDLRHCLSEQLPDNKLNLVQTRFCDLAYLISPQPYEMTDKKITGMIGDHFSQWRQLRQLKLADIAQALGLSPSLLYYIEAGPEHRGIKFQWYVEYADFLQLNLSDIFETPCPNRPGQSDEEKLRNDLWTTIAYLEQRGGQVTQQTVGQMMGIRIDAFTHNSLLREMWAEYKASRHQKREDELVNNVQRAIERLEEASQRVSWAAICRQVGLSKEALKRYSGAWEIWTKYCDATTSVESRPIRSKRDYYKNDKVRQREKDLIEQIQQAIKSLKQQKKEVSQKAIAQMVGKSPRGLKRYPRVKAILLANKAKPSHKRYDEKVLLDMLREVLNTLQTTGEEVTLKTISRLVGVSAETLKNYLQVGAFIQAEIIEKHQEHRDRQHQQRDEELALKVQQAIDLLSVEGARMTQTAVCKIVGMSSVNLKRYPKVRALFQKYGLMRIEE